MGKSFTLSCDQFVAGGFCPSACFWLSSKLFELMTVFLSVWQRKESRGQTGYEEYIPQVNFAGVNTNLVALSSRCIRFFFCV